VYHGSDASRGRCDPYRGELRGIGGVLGRVPRVMQRFAVHGSTLAGWATIMHGAVLVNSQGRRFGDETCGYSEYAAMLAQPNRTHEAG
jgi:fumarate reductase flavoprotein subunit